MELITLILTGFTSIASLIAAIASCISAIKKRELTRVKLQLEDLNKSYKGRIKELFTLYNDIKVLKQMIDDLCSSTDTNYMSVRRKYKLSEKTQAKYIEKKINELKLLL